MNRFLIPLLLACCIGTAAAQTNPAPSSGSQADANKDVVAVQDKRPVNSLCVQTGSLIKKDVDYRSSHAADCAGTSPGHTYNREDVDRTGAETTAGALQQLDPSVEIRHH